MTQDRDADRIRRGLAGLVDDVGSPRSFTGADVMRRGRRVRQRRGAGAVVAGIVAVVLTGAVAVATYRQPDGPPAATPPSGEVSTSAPAAAPVTSATGPSAGPSPTAGRSASRRPGHPDATTVGVPPGRALTPKTGNLTVREDGAVIDGWDLNGSLDVYANNVTIRNSRITSRNWWAVNLRAGYTGLKVLNSTLAGVAGQGPSNGEVDYAVSGEGPIEVGFCDISAFLNPLSIGAGSVHDNYIHRVLGGSGITHGGAASGPLTIRHNTIVNETPGGRGTSAVGLFPDSGPVADVVVDDNLIGGGQYALYGGGANATRVRVTNNRFTTTVFPNGGIHGPVAAWNAGGGGNVWTGNAWADGPQAGRPVTP